MLDSYFKLANKSDLIHRFWYDLVRIFDNLVVAYFFGQPCTVRTLTEKKVWKMVSIWWSYKAYKNVPNLLDHPVVIFQTEIQPLHVSTVNTGWPKIVSHHHHQISLLKAVRRSHAHVVVVHNNHKIKYKKIK